MPYRHFSNKEIADILYEMAALYEMAGVEFKPRAYERAAQNIESMKDEVHDVYAEGGEKALDAIPGVGKGMASHIKELFTRGHFKEYEALRKKMPVDILGLTAVEGIGAKTVKTLWQKLKIRDLNALERAAKEGKLSKLPGFGRKSEEKIAKGIAFLRSAGGRRTLGSVFSYVKKLEGEIRQFPEVEKISVAGSIRRWKETIGDIDILVTSRKPEKVMERFCAMREVGHVFGTGPTKTNVRLKSGIDADIRVIPEESWGAALCYFTGSKSHNIELRKIAIRRGLKLNEYGLFKGARRVAGKTEEEIYKALGLSYIEPELREMTGEIDAARKKTLPKLIGYNDVRGDLQVQTNWTDGSVGIKEMAEAAEREGLEYIVITDHTRGLAMTGGLDEKGILRQMKEIESLNRSYGKAGKKFSILTGTEVNIRKDGTLDIADDVLRKLDVVGAAVHSHFTLSKNEQTKRVIRAIENPNVDIIFHLTGRIINRREGKAVDIDEVIRAAKRTGTILEINAYPDRLDIKDEYVRKCVAAGVLMSIDSDAHSPEHFSLLQFGIAQARRGWAEKKDIINTLPVQKMLARLKGR